MALGIAYFYRYVAPGRNQCSAGGCRPKASEQRLRDECVARHFWNDTVAGASREPSAHKYTTAKSYCTTAYEKRGNEGRGRHLFCCQTPNCIKLMRWRFFDYYCVPAVVLISLSLLSEPPQCRSLVSWLGGYGWVRVGWWVVTGCIGCVRGRVGPTTPDTTHH